jgi:hypothetical protein
MPSALSSAPSTAIPEASCRVVQPLAQVRLADSCGRVRSSSLHQLARSPPGHCSRTAFSTAAEARSKPNAPSVIPLLVAAGLLSVYKPPCSPNIVVSQRILHPHPTLSRRAAHPLLIRPHGGPSLSLANAKLRRASPLQATHRTTRSPPRG